MIIYIRGKNDVMSNFFPCLLEFNGTTYASAEHLYQTKKAVFHDRPDVELAIMNAKDAREAKKEGGNIQSIDSEWEDIKPIVMAEILKIKFLQCSLFRETLMESKGYLAHNVEDKFWGTGGHKSKGQNVFGLLLAALRASVSV